MCQTAGVRTLCHSKITLLITPFILQKGTRSRMLEKEGIEEDVQDHFEETCLTPLTTRDNPRYTGNSGSEWAGASRPVGADHRPGMTRPTTPMSWQNMEMFQQQFQAMCRNMFMTQAATSSSERQQAPETINISNIQTQQYGIVPKMPLFSGEGKPSPREFLQAVERAIAQQHPPDEVILHQWIPALLTGDAYRWQALGEKTSWSQFKNRFQQRFISFDYRGDLKRDVHNRTQGEEEPLARYTAVIGEMAKEVWTNCSIEKVYGFIYKGANAYFKPQLRRTPPGSMEELLQIAEELDDSRRQLKNRRPPPHPRTMVNEDQGWYTNPQYKEHRRSEEEEYERKYSGSEKRKWYKERENAYSLKDREKEKRQTYRPAQEFRGRCYKCQKAGHMARVCPEDRTYTQKNTRPFPKKRSEN